MLLEYRITGFGCNEHYTMWQNQLTVCTLSTQKGALEVVLRNELYRNFRV